MKPPRLNEVFVNEVSGKTQFVIWVSNPYRRETEGIVGPFSSKQEAEKRAQEMLSSGLHPDSDPEVFELIPPGSERERLSTPGRSSWASEED
jgi:hypothetical protein